MSVASLKREIPATVEKAIERVTAALGDEGFGVLTRIDLHSKLKEKLGKDLPPTVILGACNPRMAYEAFVANSDVTALLPCNAVIREIREGKVSVELAKPTALMEVLGDDKLTKLAKTADEKLARVLERL